jgi:hypothetical protein
MTKAGIQVRALCIGGSGGMVLISLPYHTYCMKLLGSLIAMARQILSFRMKMWPPGLEGSCYYIENKAADA